MEQPLRPDTLFAKTPERDTLLAPPHRCSARCFAMVPSQHVDLFGFMPRMEDLV